MKLLSKKWMLLIKSKSKREQIVLMQRKLSNSQRYPNNLEKLVQGQINLKLSNWTPIMHLKLVPRNIHASKTMASQRAPLMLSFQPLRNRILRWWIRLKLRPAIQLYLPVIKPKRRFTLHCQTRSQTMKINNSGNREVTMVSEQSIKLPWIPTSSQGIKGLVWIISRSSSNKLAINMYIQHKENLLTRRPLDRRRARMIECDWSYSSNCQCLKLTLLIAFYTLSVWRPPFYIYLLTIYNRSFNFVGAFGCWESWKKDRMEEEKEVELKLY